MLKEPASLERHRLLRPIEQAPVGSLLIHTPVEWTNVFRRADELSAKHARSTPQRTIDLIHVAIALESGAENFLCFDNRQRLLARAAGLRTNP